MTTLVSVPSNWSTVSNFVERHKTKFLLGGVALGAIYYLTRPKPLQDQKESKKKYFSEIMKNLFENNQQTADTAVKALLPQVMKVLSEHIPLESLMASIKTTTNLQPEEKRKIWDQIKCSSFTRAITSLYSLILTETILSFQILMIGRYLFIQHIEAQEKNEIENKTVLNVETQQEFLNFFASHFPKQGVKDLFGLISKHVDQIFEQYSLKKLCVGQDLVKDLEIVRQGVESKLFLRENGVPLLSRFILPSENEDPHEGELGTLLHEVRDVLDGKEFEFVFTSCSKSLFGAFYRQIGEFCAPVDGKSPHMANIVIRVIREMKTILDPNESDFYLPAVNKNQDFSSFCLVLYSLGIEF
jgi:hypothetical protein